MLATAILQMEEGKTDEAISAMRLVASLPNLGHKAWAAYFLGVLYTTKGMKAKSAGKTQGDAFSGVHSTRTHTRHARQNTGDSSRNALACAEREKNSLCACESVAFLLYPAHFRCFILLMSGLMHTGDQTGIFLSKAFDSYLQAFAIAANKNVAPALWARSNGQTFSKVSASIFTK